MASHAIRARAPRGAWPATPLLVADPEIVSGYLEDAAHYPGGHAPGVAEPRSEAEIAALVQHAGRVLPVGAQSSLTGGATPMGDVVVRLARLDRIVEIGADEVTVEAGVPIATLQEALAREGKWYPPAPTFDGASAGGVVATNAAGAATYKYGTTRDWVRRLTVVLASGEVLDVARGEVLAHPDGYFEVSGASGTRRVPLPSYRMPDVPKRSAGYFAAPHMDLIDLFIGCEGTLGVITEVTFRVLAAPPAVCLIWIPLANERVAVDVVRALRDASRETWQTSDPRGLDVAGVEHLDRRSLELLREDGTDLRYHVAWPAGTAVVILVQLELDAREPHNTVGAYDRIAAALVPSAEDSALTRLCRLLERFGALDSAELVLPGNRRRRGELIAIREAVPQAVNQRVGQAKRRVNAAIEKTAADMIVPFERFEACLEMFRAGFERYELDHAIWGHISDANVHPNVIPKTLADVHRGQQVILDCGARVIRMGGCPLAEHGVGRSPIKQALLRQLYGNEGIEEMRWVKSALDPQFKLSPGVLFPSQGHL